MIENTQSTTVALAILRNRRRGIWLKIGAAALLLAINAWYLWHPVVSIWFYLVAIVAATIFIAIQIAEYQALARLWRSKLSGERG